MINDAQLHSETEKCWWIQKATAAKWGDVELSSADLDYWFKDGHSGQPDLISLIA